MAALQELNMRLCLLSRALSLSRLRLSSAKLYLPHHQHGHGHRHHHCHHYGGSFAVDASFSCSPSLRSTRGWNHHSIAQQQARPSPRCYSRPRGMDDDHQQQQQLGPVERGEGGSGTSMGPLTSMDFERFKDSISQLDDDDDDEGQGGTKSLLKTENVGAKWDHMKYVQQKQQMDEQTKEVQAPPNYLAMSDKELFAKCRMDTYRASGPGGQHRNKTDSAVRLTHGPTGLVVQASEDRSQHVNRAVALTRLRQSIALEVRDPVELDDFTPSPELLRILPASSSSGRGGGGNKRGSLQRVGPNHPDFVLGMKCLMDLLSATGGSVSDAGGALGLSTGSLSKLITSSPLLWQGVNKLRASKGLKPLR